jgi:hypothetical protein
MTTLATPVSPVRDSDACSCEWADRAWHDRLLRLEDEGVQGIFDLFANWADESAHDPKDRRTVDSFAFGEFVAYHSWRDPAELLRFARNLADVFHECRARGEKYPKRTYAQVDTIEQMVNEHAERLRVPDKDELGLHYEDYDGVTLDDLHSGALIPATTLEVAAAIQLLAGEVDELMDGVSAVDGTGELTLRERVEAIEAHLGSSVAS